jgi:hypothetical protein
MHRIKTLQGINRKALKKMENIGSGAMDGCGDSISHFVEKILIFVSVRKQQKSGSNLSIWFVKEMGLLQNRPILLSMIVPLV